MSARFTPLRVADRRCFLLGLGGASAGLLAPRLAAASVDPSEAYPRQLLAEVPLSQGSATKFMYPGPSDPCLLVRLRGSVSFGIGPQQDLVAYSAVCPHLGRQLGYDPARQLLGPCSWHLSVFDPAHQGRMLQGQATQDLPRVLLQQEGEQIYAVGIIGELYGKASNTQDVPSQCPGERP